MLPSRKISRILAAALLLVSIPMLSADEHFDPVGLYLTWQQDPTTTMTVDWHTLPEDGERPTLVRYKQIGTTTFREARGETLPFPFSDRVVHRVELTGLLPGTEYRFRFGDDSKEYRFRTMPASNIDPIRFVAGGDTREGAAFRRMNTVAMQYDPAFIVWGGDLPYADGQPGNVGRWYRWFEDIKETLIHEDGRVVPIVCAIGNHEIFRDRVLIRRMEAEGKTEEDARAFMERHGLKNRDAPYFFGLLAFPGKPGYNVLDFGDYMSLIILDSNHYSPIAGEQTEWLQAILAERAAQFTHIFPVYHVPAFPSVRRYAGRISALIREAWVPLFEDSGVRISFEHHDHAYKRTHPILGEEIHPDGIVYMGDGAWGVGTREPLSQAGDDPVDWYLKKTSATRHGIVVTLTGERVQLQVVSIEGEVMDETSATAKGPREARSGRR